jgi:hypothetical protein
MKTKLVRPVLMPTNDIDAKLTLYHDGNFNHCKLSTNLDKLQYHTNQQLILISLDPDEKIKDSELCLKNDIVYRYISEFNVSDPDILEGKIIA